MGKNITEEIEKLKKERNAIILAHYYQPDEIQEIADYVGDSYYLSEIARDSVENIIVFCGVKFMGESAKILSPNKTILMPSLDSGCAMADMINEGEIIEFKNKYKDAYTVCYINSSATVKAHCDVSVTSSSALDILNSIENKQILFLPDRNLGEYIAENFKEKEFILWDGCCKYHNNIKINEIYELKEKYPNSKILVHPECQKQIRDIADYIGSTAGIINYAILEAEKNGERCRYDWDAAFDLFSGGGAGGEHHPGGGESVPLPVHPVQADDGAGGEAG